jgi:hypothetical protein
MRKAILVCALAAVLFGTLLVIPSALGKGGSAKGTEVWWYEGSLGVGPLHKAVFQTTGSGIVHEWRYEPDDRALVFKPAGKFPEPDEGDYIPWTFNPGLYTIAPDSPGDLSDFFTVWAPYWLKVTMQE